MPDLTPERVAELERRIGRGIAPASPDALAALNLLLPALLAERERLIRERDEAEECVTQAHKDSNGLRRQRDAARTAPSPGFLDDVRVLITDYYSGLPEHREPAMAAAARLDEILNDEHGNPRAAALAAPTGGDTNG
jgi:hypothetical protein